MYFRIVGDVGGRCSDCRPGFKGDKGERGFDGIPGAMGTYIYSQLNIRNGFISHNRLEEQKKSFYIEYKINKLLFKTKQRI